MKAHVIPNLTVVIVMGQCHYPDTLLTVTQINYILEQLHCKQRGSTQNITAELNRFGIGLYVVCYNVKVVTGMQSDIVILV